MRIIQIKNLVLNDILDRLQSKEKLIISGYLNSIGIESPSLKRVYESKLKTDGYIKLTPLTWGRNSATITDKGRLFIRNGGYKKGIDTKTNMTQNELKNFILKEMESENAGVSVPEVTSDLGLSLNELQIKEIESDLYSKRYITISKPADGSRYLHITDIGRDFINSGGFKSSTQEEVGSIIKSHSNKLSKIFQDSKTQAEIRSIYLKLQEVFDRLVNKIGVVSDDELKIITAPLIALYEEYYGSLSGEVAKCRSKTKDLAKCRVEILPFVKDTLTRLELKLGLSYLILHPKIKATSETLFADGHYRQAILDAFILLENEIKRIANSPKIGKELMDEVFSAASPKIRISTDKGEQQGIMFLFGGSVMAIRNRYAHKTKKVTDREYTIDLLHFASALMRLVEDTGVY